MSSPETEYLIAFRRRGRHGIARDDLAGWAAARPELELRSTPEGALEIWAVPSGRTPLLIWEEGEVWARQPLDQIQELARSMAQDLACSLVWVTTPVDSTPGAERAEIRRGRREGAERARRQAWRTRLLWGAVVVGAALAGWFLG